MKITYRQTQWVFRLGALAAVLLLWTLADHETRAIILGAYILGLLLGFIGAVALSYFKARQQ